MGDIHGRLKRWPGGTVHEVHADFSVRRGIVDDVVVTITVDIGNHGFGHVGACWNPRRELNASRRTVTHDLEGGACAYW